MSTDEFDGFEWDEVKSQRTMRERGFDFEFASRVFDFDYIESEDRRLRYGEPRYVTLGRVEDVLITVVWTPRAKRRRIIAAWPSSNQERRKYHEYYPEAKN